jgi:hypothetical protein
MDLVKYTLIYCTMCVYEHVLKYYDNEASYIKNTTPSQPTFSYSD